MMTEKVGRIACVCLCMGLPFVVLVFSCTSCRRTDPEAVPEVSFAGADSNETAPTYTDDPTVMDRRGHRAFAERIEERRRMVALQIKLRGIDDPNVLTAMQAAPRHFFVLPEYAGYAYDDYPLPIDEGQTISQPYVVAFMTEALRLRADSKVLEIGTGSGYQAAVCAEIADEVYSIEIVEKLATSAAEKLEQLGYSNVHVRAGDGYFGWPDKSPFDAIIGTAAAGRIPPPLLEQLSPGGRMILPRTAPDGSQYLTLITKNLDGSTEKTDVMPVRFVPMTGEVMKSLDSDNR